MTRTKIDGRYPNWAAEIESPKWTPDAQIIPFDAKPPEHPKVKVPKYSPFRNSFRPAPDSYSAILGDLMWISSQSYEGSRLYIHGTIIPPDWPDSWDALMIALAARHGLIVHRLEEHGTVLLGMPTFQVTGRVAQMTGEKPTHHDFREIEARMDITVRA